MMHAEAQTFFDNEIRGLYPKWEPTPVQASKWVAALKRFTPEIADIALGQFYKTREGGFKTPSLPKIIELARAQQQREGISENKVGGAPVLLYTLRCTEHSGKRTGMIEKFYANPKKVPADKSIIMRGAESLVKKFEHLYGGAWEIIRNWDTEEIPF